MGPNPKGSKPMPPRGIFRIFKKVKNKGDAVSATHPHRTIAPRTVIIDSDCSRERFRCTMAGSTTHWAQLLLSIGWAN